MKPSLSVGLYSIVFYKQVANLSEFFIQNSRSRGGRLGDQEYPSRGKTKNKNGSGCFQITPEFVVLALYNYLPKFNFVNFIQHIGVIYLHCDFIAIYIEQAYGVFYAE